MVFVHVLKKQRQLLLGRLKPDQDKEKLAPIDVKIPPNEEEENDRFFTLSCITTVYLWIAIILLTLLISAGGIYLYVQYGPNSQSERFHGWCNIPMQEDDYLPISEKYFSSQSDSQDSNTFHEDFEISADEKQARISVPGFRDGRPGRFLHDFNMNLTAIVDIDSERCFVLPLDRKAVLPPRSMIDMLNKMMTGYYNVNMNLIKRNMRVVIPPLDDLSEVGFNIMAECAGYKIYRLEKTNRAIYKRSADASSPVKFLEFAGNDVQELDIVNFDEMLNYEKQLSKNPK